MPKLLENKKWKQHTWFKQGYVEEFDVNFLKSISHPNPTEYTDMPDGSVHHQNIIFDSIENEGMQKPLMILLSPQKETIRLESGNHRINVAIKRGYTHLPCAVAFYNKGILDIGNGDHLFNIDELIINIKKLKTLQKFDTTIFPMFINPYDIFKTNKNNKGVIL